MNSIAENSLCSGCGVCSAACPKSCISLSENARGELRPTVDNSICVSCGKCRSVCPFDNTPEKIDKKTETVFLGSAPEFAKNGSSGGVATYFISAVLRNKIADRAVLVKPQNDSSELFAYSICENDEDIKKCQGSAYYPVTLERILKDIKSLDGTVAVIGVPCFINALKNLKSNDNFWDKKISVLIGIVCGHTPNRHLVDCLAAKSGHSRSDITACRFRVSAPERPAWDYGVRLSFSDKSETTSFGSDDFGFLFWRRLFIQNCCLNCSDVFAENADITFMDAWLPEYKKKTEGTSLLICRNKVLKNLLDSLIDGGVLKQTDTKDIFTAQEKLIDYKNSAGKHQKDEKLEQKVQKIFAAHKDKKDIIERIRYLCYKENLKHKNIALWLILEIKDRLKG